MSDPAEIPLFAAFPALARRIPRRPLGQWPTLVTHLANFGPAHNLPHLYIKREDLSHPDCGGNKVRGLEFLLADAQSRSATTILTMGAAGSHHVARTALHAAKLGMHTTAVLLRQPMAEYVRRNLLLASSIGATLVPANALTIIPRLFALRYFTAHRPYFIAPGGTTPLACLGHVNAAFELKAQIDRGDLPAPDFIYVPLGSLGTCAGLLLGVKLAGLTARLVGVVTSYRWYATPSRIVRLADKTHALMRRLDPAIPDARLSATDIDVITTSLGPGYAQFTADSVELARDLFTREQIEFDGTYTAKALAGALNFIADRSLANRAHLFWHTYHRLKIALPSNITLAPWIASYIREPAQPLDQQLQ